MAGKVEHGLWDGERKKLAQAIFRDAVAKTGDYADFRTIAEKAVNAAEDLSAELGKRYPQDPRPITFDSVVGLALALKMAEEAHAVYEKQLGHRDETWADWYAAHMAGGFT